MTGIPADKIKLKRANEQDWLTIRAFEKQAASTSYFPLTKKKELLDYLRQSHVFLILLNDQPIGTVSYEIKPGNTIYFDGLTILPKLRGHGLATTAMEQMFSKLKKYDKFSAVVHPHNIPSLRLCLSLGFGICGWNDDYFGDGQPRLILEKK